MILSGLEEIASLCANLPTMSAGDKLIIYGQSATRTNRVLWMASELGIPFELRPLPLLDPGFDEINPNRKQPCIVDTDGTTVFESMACNLYLLRKCAGKNEITPNDLNEEAKVLQWSVWAISEHDMRL